MENNIYDVVVVGSGAAGLYACLCLPSHYRVALITKAQLKTGASDWAQGGIAAAIAPTDSTQSHYQDTLSAGAGLCEPAAVEFLVAQAPQAIAELVELGVSFDRHQGDLALTLEAAHSQPRVLHAADTTGRAIVSTLMEQVEARANIEIFSQAVALTLLVDPETSHCQGVQVCVDNTIRPFWAGAVLLTTGGGGQVFAQTTNPKVSTGDGIALAWRAGAQLRDLEFFQFHPTALTKPNVPHFLISEAVRGEGAHLLDKTGRRFAFDYHPQGELAPRDVVSRAIFQHLANTETNPSEATVFLELSPIDPARIRHRFPNIIRRCQKWGIDLFAEPIPVVPAAHYWMGGIVTDLQCQTTLPGLYALGETASIGVHGANRLASNSLLECIVFARQLRHLTPTPPTPSSVQNHQTVSLNLGDSFQGWMQTIRAELPRLMWQSAGICRTASHLQAAITQVETWQAQWQALPLSQALSPQLGSTRGGAEIQLTGASAGTSSGVITQWSELGNLLTVAELILNSAAFRQESRGGHFRTDFPETLTETPWHTLIRDRQWHHCPVGALTPESGL